MKKSNIYTCSGDKGTTALIGGSRVAKDSMRLEAYGTVDELNAYIGVLVSCIPSAEHKQQLQWIQQCLFNLGTHLATPTPPDGSCPTCLIADSHLQKLEGFIDETDAQVVPLRCFILPGGTTPAAFCHVCRTVCRRCERHIITLSKEVPLSPIVLAFINRLSDYFFVLSRYVNKKEDCEEFLWEKDC